MRVKISDRMTEVKIEKWMNGEVGIFNKSEVNCSVNDVDLILLSKRALTFNEVVGIDYWVED